MSGFTKNKFILLFAALACTLTFLSSLAGCGRVHSGTAVVNAASAPDGTVESGKYGVWVRDAAGGKWTKLFVYSVPVGHQRGNMLDKEDKLYTSPVPASMVCFDFSGEIEIRISFLGGTLESYDLSPHSYGLASKQNKDGSVSFTVSQNPDAPRKIVFRANGNQDADCLHIVTNLPEENAPDKYADNVCLIKAGDEIPLYLPEGKDTYYFEAGTHVLPRGLWFELDLGSVKTLESFDFIAGKKATWVVPGGMNFRIECKQSADEAYETVSEITGDGQNLNLSGVALQKVSARYIRVTVLGNTDAERDVEHTMSVYYTGYNGFNVCTVSEFRLYDEDGNNLAQGKAVRGALSGFEKAVDGNENTRFSVARGGEAFLISQSGTTLYLEPGSVLYGALGGYSIENTNICGRGILNGSLLLHEPFELYAEARTSCIMFNYSRGVNIEGITVIDSPMWSVAADWSEDITVSGINVFGSIVIADGIHFSGSKNAVASGCFVRACDDLLAVYEYGDSSNILFENCVLWSDGARAVLIGLANLGNITGVTVRNCDVIQAQNVINLSKFGGIIQIWGTGDKTITDILIEDFRVQPLCFDGKYAPLFQIKTLADSAIGGTGSIGSVTLRNISCENPPLPWQTYIAGEDAAHSVGSVTISGLTYSGTAVTAENFSEYFLVLNNVGTVEIDGVKVK